MAKSKDTLQQALAIGRICMEWSTLEYNIAILIWVMLKLPTAEVGKIVTGGLDILPRLNMAIALSTELRMPIGLTKALITTRKNIQDGLDVRRNMAVHGIHFLEDDGSTTVEVHRGKNRKMVMPIAGDDYMRLSEEIRDIRVSLQRQVRKAGLDCLPQPRDETADRLAQTSSGQGPGPRRNPQVSSAGGQGAG